MLSAPLELPVSFRFIPAGASGTCPAYCSGPATKLLSSEPNDRRTGKTAVTRPQGTGSHVN